MKTVICDVDETILYSRQQVPGSIEFTYRDEPYPSYTIARPSAEEFIKTLKSKGYWIVGMTQGLVEFQRMALEYAGLWQYYDALFGYTDTREIYNSSYTPSVTPMPDFDNWVLIDNLDYRDRTLMVKMGWLKSSLDPKRNFVQCIPFYGLEGPEESLMELIPRIEELLNA